MKKTFVSFALMLLAVGAQAKDIKTLVVTTVPQMHCNSCETKIKGNLRFEKGVKTIETNIDEQRVTISYDADKTTPTTLINAFEKFGYKATELKADDKKQKEKVKVKSEK